MRIMVDARWRGRESGTYDIIAGQILYITTTRCLLPLPCPREEAIGPLAPTLLCGLLHMRSSYHTNMTGRGRQEERGGNFRIGRPSHRHACGAERSMQIQRALLWWWYYLYWARRGDESSLHCTISHAGSRASIDSTLCCSSTERGCSHQPATN